MKSSLRLAASLLLAFQCLTAFAEKADPGSPSASAPEAPLSKACVALVGMAEGSADTQERARYVQLTHAGIDQVASELRRRHVDAVTSFSDVARPGDGGPGPTHVDLLLETFKTNCARLVQLSFRAKENAAGPVIGFDVAVVRIVISGSDPIVVKSFDVEFAKRYAQPRTSETLANFDANQYAGRIADELVASGKIPVVP